jgi:hypothetical protein
MALGKRIARMLGACVLGAMVAAGLHAAEPSTLQQARAGSLPPLVGSWFSPQQNAPITTLQIVTEAYPTDLEVPHLFYIIKAVGSIRGLGTATANVPQDPSAPVTVSYQSTTCQPRTRLCTPVPLIEFTTVTITRPDQFLEVRVTTRYLGVTRTTTEEMVPWPI